MLCLLTALLFQNRDSNQLLCHTLWWEENRFAVKSGVFTAAVAAAAACSTYTSLTGEHIIVKELFRATYEYGVHSSWFQECARSLLWGSKGTGAMNAFKIRNQLWMQSYVLGNEKHLFRIWAGCNQCCVKLSRLHLWNSSLPGKKIPKIICWNLPKTHYVYYHICLHYICYCYILFPPIWLEMAYAVLFLLICSFH